MVLLKSMKPSVDMSQGQCSVHCSALPLFVNICPIAGPGGDILWGNGYNISKDKASRELNFVSMSPPRPNLLLTKYS